MGLILIYNRILKTAADLKVNETAIIKRIDRSHPSYRRLLEIGFTPGQEITLLNRTLFNDPISFSIRGTIFAIRKEEASHIFI